MLAILFEPDKPEKEHISISKKKSVKISSGNGSKHSGLNSAEEKPDAEEQTADNFPVF
jgi:hypothetical protein